MIRCLTLWATMLVLVGCTSDLAKIAPPVPRMATMQLRSEGVVEDQPPVPLPDKLVFELHFPTNVTANFIFEISSSTNLIDWEPIPPEIVPADNTPSPTTNWEYTVYPNWSEPTRYWKIQPIGKGQ